MEPKVEASPHRSAVVTGAGAGIGRAIVDRLVADGYRLHVLDRDPEALESVAAACGPSLATSHVVDVSDADAVADACRSIVDTSGSPWLLVNNAGMGRSLALLGTDLRVWQRVLDVNLTGTFTMCKGLLPSMLDNDGGVIVNIASAAALVALRDRFAYSTAKAGMLGLTRSIAADYGPDGIRCNAICPGTVDTPWNQRVAQAAPDPAAAEQTMHARSLDGRMGTPADIAGGVAFLAGEDARFMNGAVMVIDGGMTIHQ